MVMEYGTLNLTNFTSIKSPSADIFNVDFTFKIKFTKRPNLNFFFQIILPILILLAFFYALMQTFFYKVRQQKIEYDFAILLNFIVNFFANVSNVLFAFILALSCYVFFIYKTQSSVIKITLPLEREEEAIGIMLAIALVFKVKCMKLARDLRRVINDQKIGWEILEVTWNFGKVTLLNIQLKMSIFLQQLIKLSKIFSDMITLDIFFIDFERPKYNNSDNFLHGSNKSHPGTPSISSSLKPLSSPSPSSGECVSAWRNYFIANEWQELITRRKVSIHLHIVAVIGFLMVWIHLNQIIPVFLNFRLWLQIFGFENLASLEHFLHLNHTQMQNYLNFNKMESDSNDIVSVDIILKVAVGAMVYLGLYLSQRLFNFIIYERFVDNCIQQFIDVSSIANISVLILLNSYGFYIHGRSGTIKW